MTPVPVLLLSGPVGVGKTCLGEEVSNQLARKGVAHALIDFDQLCQAFPRPEGDRFGIRLGAKNLRDIWRNNYAHGPRNLILPYVIETADDRGTILASIPGAQSTLIQLSASIRTLEARIRKREIGSWLEQGLARSAELAKILATAPADHRIGTNNRKVAELADELIGLVDWA